MPFKKGREKTGGRKKGTKNKLNLGVEEALELKGINCVDEMLLIAQKTDKEDIKLAVYKELLKYVYPQRKAVDVSADIDMNNEPFEVRFI